MRTNHPLPRRQRVFYFETTIVSPREKLSVTVGLVNDVFPLNEQPGAVVSGLKGARVSVLSLEGCECLSDYIQINVSASAAAIGHCSCVLDES